MNDHKPSTAFYLLSVLALSSRIFSLGIQQGEARRKPSYWPRYEGKREVWVLDGSWNASRLPENTHFDSINPSLDIGEILTNDSVLIPSSVDSAPPGQMGYRGVSFFRTKIRFDVPVSNSEAALGSQAAARLQFQACGFYCRVWLNGVDLGDHRAGGYVAFTLDVPLYALQQQRSESSGHDLFVLTDNRWNTTTAPLHTGGDFWAYGGILRSVEWHVLPLASQSTWAQHHSQSLDREVWPWRAYVFPESNLKEVRVEIQLSDFSFTGIFDQTIRVSFDGEEQDDAIEFSTVAVVEGRVKLGSISVPNPRIWHPHHPYLHTLSVDINGALVTERFGLRYWDIHPDTPRLRLNGDILKLVGWNHHTQWPRTAASPTEDQMDADIELLLNGNANFVRGAHYPQDPRWLDRLDEAGFVMWSETLGPDVKVNNFTNPYFLKYQEQQIHEMMSNAMNHASIAFWAFFNEGESGSVESCPAYQASSDAIRSRDTTRFVTYASNVPNDKCFDAVDVISWNSYPGWYSHGDIAEVWNHFAHEATVTDGKPFVISETGAGGIYEWTHNETKTKWTLEYQVEVLSADVDTAIKNSNISGISLWHFFDFKVDDQHQHNTSCDYLPHFEPPTCGYIDVNVSSPSGRPGGLNHKGVLDFYRRPKPSYSIVAKKYRSVIDRRSSFLQPFERYQALLG